MKCPYCNRTLTEDERYCFFCEQKIKKISKKPKKESSVVAYCVKCREKVNVKDPEYYTMKNKRLSIKGRCPNCGTKVFRILGLKK
jgi:hypothetical protein